VHPRSLHFTPTYSSWLNQIELWFGKIERDVIARGVFTSVLSDRESFCDTSVSTTNRPVPYSGNTDPIAPYQYTISWYRPLVEATFLLPAKQREDNLIPGSRMSKLSRNIIFNLLGQSILFVLGSLPFVYLRGLGRGRLE